MAQRYAIYLAPHPETRLWSFGSRVLGYDAATGQDINGFAPGGMTRGDWGQITERPRQYGFHATLKAPFTLVASKTEGELLTELGAFCEKRARFTLGPLAVEALSMGHGNGFAALTHQRASLELEALEHDTVRAFDHFRTPMSDADFKRRQPETLTMRQRESLIRFGYPFVGHDYRFHMTLSGVISGVSDIADTLADTMANEIGTVNFHVDALVLFRQANARERFRIIRRFDLL